MGWATFWVIFSQAHLVTLDKCNKRALSKLSVNWIRGGTGSSSQQLYK
jgi:hypothetical protein